MQLPLSIEETEAIIPQKQPFVLISRLLAASEAGGKTAFTIPENHVLVDNGELQPSGLMENMAQSCAALMGFRGAMLGEQPKIGFIGDIRSFTFSKLPKVGTTIETNITIENQIFDVTMIGGQIFENGEPIAECKMKIFVRPQNG